MTSMTTIRSEVEKFLASYYKIPEELYSDDRVMFSKPIPELGKIIVQLQSGRLIYLFDVEQYIYDYGSDTHFLDKDSLYFVSYTSPKVMCKSHVPFDRGENVWKVEEIIDKVTCVPMEELIPEEKTRRQAIIDELTNRYTSHEG